MNSEVLKYFKRVRSGEIDHPILTIRDRHSNSWMTYGFEKSTTGAQPFESNIHLGFDGETYGFDQDPSSNFVDKITRRNNRIEIGSIFRMDNTNRFFIVKEYDNPNLIVAELEAVVDRTSFFDRMIQVKVDVEKPFKHNLFRRHGSIIIEDDPTTFFLSFVPILGHSIFGL